MKETKSRAFWKTLINPNFLQFEQFYKSLDSLNYTDFTVHDKSAEIFI